MPEPADALAGQTIETAWEKNLSAEERELLHEIFRALRVIRYGSVLITVHDGRVAEIQKTERIRKSAAKHA